MRTTAVVEDGGFHLSWGAIFGGVFVSLGVAMLLHALGLAAGLTAIDPTEPGSLRGVGIGTGIWSVLVPLIALFVGGWVAARTAGFIERSTGAIHGAVVWGLTTVVGVALLGMALASMMSAGIRMGAAVARGGGDLAGAGAEALGLDVGDALGPVNQRLQAQGLPPVTTAQVQAATRDVISQAMREGRLDRRAVIEALARNTALDQDGAALVADRIQAQFNQRYPAIRDQLQTTALRAAEQAAKAFWAVFLTLLLGLISAVAGALTGTSRRQRIAVRRFERADVGTAVPITPVVTTPEPSRP